MKQNKLRAVVFCLRKYGAFFLDDILCDNKIIVEKVYTRKEDFLYKPDIYEVCDKYNIHCEYLNKFTGDIIDEIISIRPDIILCYSFHLKIPEIILNIPEYKAINFHPSFLPKLRGPNPIEYSLYHGYKATGVTAHILTDTIDGGDIIDQSRIIIKDCFNAEDLSYLIYKESVRILEKIINNIICGNGFSIFPQNEKNATYCEHRSQLNFTINLKEDKASTIINKVRAGYIYPGAKFNFSNRNMIIKKVDYSAIADELSKKMPRGSIFQHKNNYYFYSIDQKELKIIEWYFEKNKLL